MLRGTATATTPWPSCVPGPRERPGEIDHHDGGRGLSFLDPTGTTRERTTVPCGGWPDPA